ncbi:PP2C family protein-serine/threonine phosphatase [Nonomuraea sp. NPDC003214]
MTSTTTAADVPGKALNGTVTGPAGPVAYASHIGLVRSRNNDHAAVRVGPSFTALAVADGVGAPQEAGEAAALAAEVAAAAGAYAGTALVASDTAVSAVAGAYVEAPRYVQHAATSTLVVAVIGHNKAGGPPSWVDIAWLGDSSVWALFDDGAFERVTTPHNPPFDEHVVLRTVTQGEPDMVTLHLDEQPVRRLIVCSDGLDGYVEHDLIELLAAEADSAERARDLLVEAALEAGGRDNVSVIVVDLEVGEPGRGYVEACPGCGRADPGVITRGDSAATVVTSCCEAEVTPESV